MKTKLEIPKKEELWKYVVTNGRKIEKGYVANKFDVDDIETILATMEFFGATDIWMKQTYFDLASDAKPFAPKYRLFDWLAMCIMSRNDDDRKQNEQALKVLVYSWLKVGGNSEAFIQDLRETDYDIEEDWKEVEIK